MSITKTGTPSPKEMRRLGFKKASAWSTDKKIPALCEKCGVAGLVHEVWRKDGREQVFFRCGTCGHRDKV